MGKIYYLNFIKIVNFSIHSVNPTDFFSLTLKSSSEPDSDMWLYCGTVVVPWWVTYDVVYKGFGHPTFDWSWGLLVSGSSYLLIYFWPTFFLHLYLFIRRFKEYLLCMISRVVTGFVSDSGILIVNLVIVESGSVVLDVRCRSCICYSLCSVCGTRYSYTHTYSWIPTNHRINTHPSVRFMSTIHHCLHCIYVWYIIPFT